MSIEGKKIPLLIIAGPTASGKTAISIKLAKLLDGEIISADSMQVYKYMDIGTAKIRQSEMQGVKHHLIDILEPDEEFSAAAFKKRAKECISDIHKRGKLPIIVGGTGFYIQAVLYDIDFSEYTEASEEKINRFDIDEKSESWLEYEKLKTIDPEYAGIIHMNDHKRVKNALKFYENTGKTMSQHNKEQEKRESPYNYLYVVLTNKRENIYTNIEKRIDQMIADGLVDEVKKLLNKGYGRSLVSMQGLGYKEIASYIDGECSLDEAVTILKGSTRHFAKRQFTWYKREQNRGIMKEQGCSKISKQGTCKTSMVFIDKSEVTNEDKIIEMIICKIETQKNR